MVDSDATNNPNRIAGPVIEEQGRALMQAVPDLVFLLGLDGTYIDIFSAADEDLFVPREQLIGRTALDVLPAPVGKDCMDAIRSLQSPRDVSSFSYELLIDGKPRWFEGRVSLCGTDSVIVLVRDFTEQRLAERDLRDANNALRRRALQLQRLEQELTQVEQRERQRMAHVLHDNLQQLLVGAKFNASILAHRAAVDADRDNANVIIEVLDEAIRQSQMLTVELCPPILYEGSFTQSLEWIKKHVARLHGLHVKVSMETSSDINLNESVRFTIFNAIRELLLNVVKHAGVMEAFIAISTPSPDLIAVRVGDDGQGFSPEKIAQAEENGETGGFGLFTLRERVSWLGGSVAVKSQAGCGCTVTLTLPLLQADEERAAVSDEAGSGSLVSSQKPLKSKNSQVRVEGTIRVVLADDHAVLREGLVRILLQDPSFSVVGEASDGETAVEMALKLRPDVVLMDVMMPGIGGAEATKLIKKSAPDVQVIALSMYEENERGEEMYAAGATDYITKSQAAFTIAHAIRSCVKK